MNWRTYFTEQRRDLVDTLRQLVELESPSPDKAAVDRVGAFVAAHLRASGAEVRFSPQTTAGDHVIGTWPAGPETPAPVLLLFHMDTVWPLGTLATMPWSEKDGILRGPGVYDMKASLAIALRVVRALQTLGIRPARPLRLLFTSDEEVGSLTSRSLIEAEAQRAALVLCMEPALPDGSLKTARKGVGEFRVTAYGRAAHAGADHHKGINAIEELAHQVIAIQRLTDYQRGLTVNVGLMSGGTATNVVPEQATLEVDVRVERTADADWMAQQLAALRPVLAGARLEIRGGLNRPPMEHTPLMAQTFERVKTIAAGLGLTLTEGATGGGSDANFTAALGVPTLDGLGAVGNGSHSADEHVVASSLPERAALLAAIVTQW